MRVCKHGCDVTKMFCFSWANHTSTNLKKFFSSKLNKFTLFKPIPSSAETWKIFTNKLCQFFFLLELTFQVRKIRILESIFCKTRTDLIRVQDFVYKTLQLVKISVLISAITKSFVFFLGKVTLFLHSRGWKNSRQLCTPQTLSLVCITVSNSPITAHVYIRPCKHGKHFPLLKYYTRDEPITSTGYIEKQINIYKILNMSQMFTVGEIATNSPHANAGSCNSTVPSIREFVVVCKTSAVSHNLLLKCNEMC